MDRHRVLLEQFLAEREAALRRAVDEKWAEGAYLEFKTASAHGPPVHDPDRNNLARALSGFSNAEGGLTIWGIKSKEGRGRRPKIAQELRPIAELDRFIRDLERETGLVTTPLVGGVEHHAIRCDEDPSAGYVLTFVPKGEGEPIMVNGPNCYTFRCGDQFLPMPHGMVADRFHRRPQPKLALHCEFAGTSGSAAHPIVRVSLGIKNEGRGIALHPMLRLAPQRSTSSEFRWSSTQPTLPPRLHDIRADPYPWKVFASDGGEAVHAGTHRVVTLIQFRMTDRAVPPDLEIRYEIYCDGDACVGSHTVKNEDLRACRDEVGK